MSTPLRGTGLWGVDVEHGSSWQLSTHQIPWGGLGRCWWGAGVNALPISVDPRHLAKYIFFPHNSIYLSSLIPPPTSFFFIITISLSLGRVLIGNNLFVLCLVNFPSHSAIRYATRGPDKITASLSPPLTGSPCAPAACFDGLLYFPILPGVTHI